jgi:hypothetical protein
MPSPPAGAPAATAQKAKKERKTKKATRNEPTVDLKAELKRICGVDLTSIDGINVITAQTIISEIGTDMSGFRTENHFASWLGLTPSKDISGGKFVGPGRRKVQNRVAMALRMASTTLLKQQELPGRPVSAPAQAAAFPCGGDQGHGPLPGGAGLPHAHPRRSLGGLRRGEIRAKAHRNGAGKFELQSKGERIQTDSDHRSQLSPPPMESGHRRRAMSTQGRGVFNRRQTDSRHAFPDP